MITISKLAKLSGVSEKAIRLYEKRGLISKPNRHDNNYRFFNEEHVKEIKKILSLKSLGLSLKEIKIFIFSLEKNSEKNLKEFYLKQLIKTNQELLVLEKRKLALTRAVNVTDQLLTSKIIKSSKGVTMNRDMEELFALKERAKIKYAKYGVNAIKYIEREKFFDSEDKIQFIEDMKAVIQFLKKTKIKIGPLRGPASTSLLLDLLGINCINPLSSLLEVVNLSGFAKSLPTSEIISLRRISILLLILLVQMKNELKKKLIILS
ncbi:MAG: MerR family transcriptional regulator [Bacteriovoracaceae bacterium]